jgi:hypothetical protein
MQSIEKSSWRGVSPEAVFIVCPKQAPVHEPPLALRESRQPRPWSCEVFYIDAETQLESTAETVSRLVVDARLRKDTPPVPQDQNRDRAAYVYVKLDPTVPSKLYDSYWRFAAERQAIFFRRLRGQRPPWTDDPILLKYKFTNAYRASDRVSQFLIRHVIYEGNQDPSEVFFRTILFKLFNRIETWKLLEQAIGTPMYSEFDFDRYDGVLSRAMAEGKTIYSAAYIMPTTLAFGVEARKHRTHLRLLERMMADSVPYRILDAGSLRNGFELLRSYPMLGDFLSYQYIVDLNYSGMLNHRESEFVVPGPGAREGLAKCFSSPGGLSDSDLIRLVTDRQQMEFERLGIRFESLWGRRLQLVDCQNLFCEVDKYSRLAYPEIKGRNGRTRIKQLYRPGAAPLEYWYPPKWGLNTKLDDQKES